MSGHISCVVVDAINSSNARLEPMPVTAVTLPIDSGRLAFASTEMSGRRRSTDCSKKRDELATFGLRRAGTQRNTGGQSWTVSSVLAHTLSSSGHK
jgi:hypothetical protein